MTMSSGRPSIVLKRVDWRGWIAVAWVLFWGFSFCGMVVRARGDRIKDWFRPEKAIVTARESEGLQSAPGRDRFLVGNRDSREPSPALTGTLSRGERDFRLCWRGPA
jgi:hypothetical protein